MPAPPQTSGPLLHIDIEPRAGDVLRARVTLYVPDVNQPLAPMHECELAPELWDRLRRRIADFDETIQIGRLLWRELLSDKIRAPLARYADRPLIVLGDEVASSIPWELLIEDREERTGLD